MYRLADMITQNLKIYEWFQQLHGNLCVRVFCLMSFERISLLTNSYHSDNKIFKVFLNNYNKNFSPNKFQTPPLWFYRIAKINIVIDTSYKYAL